MSETIYDDVTLEMNRETTEIMVDINESSDSVGNYEVMKNTGKISTEKQQVLQHTGRVSVKNRRHRSVQVCLCLPSVLLLTALIVICVYFNNETNKLLTHNYNLTKENEKLLTKYSDLLNQSRILTEEIEKFRNKRYELQRGLSEQDQCSDNFKWVYYNFSFYYISSDQKRWSDSRRDCEDRGANLVIINNQEEQEFLQKAIAGQYYYWIGLSQERSVWKFVNDTTLTLSFWIYGHPRHNHTCAVTSASGWVSYLCNGYQRWICEKRILQSLII